MDVAMARSMRSCALVALPLALIACNQNQSSQQTTFPETKAECAATAVPNRFIVQWKNGTTTVEHAADREAFIRDVLEPNEGKITFAEHDQIVQLSEPGGITVGEAAADPADWGQTLVGAPDVWAQGVKGDGVIVAVVDSGVDITHSQIQPRLAINPGEIPNNGIDDDHNGYVDDVSGYDFESRTGDVKDGTGHGTHVAGTILADHTTGIVKGMAPEAKLLPLDFMDDEGSGSLSVAIEAMNYAAARGAKIINASWGGAPCSKSLERAITQLESKGILFISAAGNSGVDIEQNPEYPAAYALPNQLTIGASTARDYMSGFSNYSYHLVNLMAPGSQIFSTYPGNHTATMSGTSMATPFVSGAAALLWSFRPTATLAQIREAILNSVDPGNFAVSSHGRLNVKHAIEELQKLVP
jgi:subtilisin family serine protease